MDKNALFMAMWDELGRMGFRHRERYGDTFRRLYDAETAASDPTSRGHLAFVRRWLLVPASCWPFDFNGFGKYLVSEVKRKRPLSPRVTLILKMVRRFPSSAAQEIIRQHEEDVCSGDYGRFWKPTTKFQALQEAKEKDPIYLEDLAAIKGEFDIDRKGYRDAEGIIRRPLLLERGRKPEDWYLNSLSEEEQEFELAFTGFCYEHNLYGIMGDKPLLLKVTVNVTPFSALLEIPCYLLPDFSRDFNWPAVGKLLEAIGGQSVGEKRVRNQQEKLDQALKVYTAALAAEGSQLKGETRRAFIAKESGLGRDTDDRKIRKLLSVAREHLGLRRNPYENL